MFKRIVAPLFPLLALAGAIIGLAVRGAGPRWGGAAAVGIVGLAAIHTGAALLLTVSRYYGSSPTIAASPATIACRISGATGRS